MTKLQVKTKKCREENVVLDETFRKHMTKNIKLNKKILERLAQM